jgi:hypothetical protein
MEVVVIKQRFYFSCSQMNNVLAISAIEEGALKVNVGPASIKDVMLNLEHQLQVCSVST